MTRLAPYPRLTGTEPCRQPETDPEWWTGDDRTDRVVAQLSCRRCPVREACLAWAIDHPKDTGDTIWAGTTRGRRTELRREFTPRTPTSREEPT